MAIPDIDVPETCFDRILNYVNEVNASMILGYFTLEKEEHAVAYHFAQFHDERFLPPIELINFLFNQGIDTTESAAEAVLRLIDGKISVEEAVALTVPDDENE